MNAQPRPFTVPRFVCDDMVGKLARLLRMIGYYAHYFRRIDDAQLIGFASEKGYVLLTRDTLLLPRRGLGPHLFIRFDHPHRQLRQVVDELDLAIDTDRFYSLCLECNRALVAARSEEVRGLVPPYVYDRQTSFSRCDGCRRIFWPATHREGMDRRLRRMLGLSDSMEGEGTS